MKKLILSTLLILIAPLTANAGCYGGCNINIDQYLTDYFNDNPDLFKGEKGDTGAQGPIGFGVDGTNGKDGLNATSTHTIERTTEYRYEQNLDISAGVATAATMGNGLAFAAQKGTQGGVHLAVAGMKKLNTNFRVGLTGVYDTRYRDTYGAVVAAYVW